MTRQDSTGKTSPDIAKLFGVDGLVAITTGGGSGIGYMMATGLIDGGAAKVYVLGDKKEGSPKFVPIHCDVTSKQALQASVGQITSETGYINLLICNAGKVDEFPDGPDPTSESSIADLRNFFFSGISFEQHTSVFNLNTTAVLFASFAFIELLDASNKKSNAISNAPDAGVRSQIIATSSAGGFMRIGPEFTYNASKAATTHLMKSMAPFLIPWRIRCNIVAPGWFPCAITKGLLDEYPDGNLLLSLCPAERMGREEEMVGTVLYLASRAGGYCNGSVGLLDGGGLGAEPGTY